MDESEKPLYPFGYGLSYTTFAYSDLNVEVKGNNKVEVSVNVTNTGEVAGEEVVQLYINDEVASVVRPIKELKGFEKISLEPNEYKQIKFTIGEKELGFYNGEGKFLIEQGAFKVFVGTNSEELLEGEFVLE
jgi:beta-glucosidase